MTFAASGLRRSLCQPCTPNKIGCRLVPEKGLTAFLGPVQAFPNQCHEHAAGLLDVAENVTIEIDLVEFLVPGHDHEIDRFDRVTIGDHSHVNFVRAGGVENVLQYRLLPFRQTG